MKKLHLFLAVATLLVACDGSTEPSGPGTLTASLVSPNGAEGAAVLDITGTVETVTGNDDVAAYTTPGATGTRVVLVRMNPGALTVRFRVPDVSRPPQVSVVEVADGDDRVRSSLDGYRVEID
jgi:hypothetical protein